VNDMIMLCWQVGLSTKSSWCTTTVITSIKVHDMCHSSEYFISFTQVVYRRELWISQLCKKLYHWVSLGVRFLCNINFFNIGTWMQISYMKIYLT